MLRIEKCDDEHKLNPLDVVRVKEMGNIIELMYMEKVNHKIYIKKISEDEYLDLRTGEVKESNRIKDRSCNYKSIRQSLSRLRDYINTNVVDVSCCKWVTLTYAENMTDTKRLYNDFDKFNKRLKYRYKDFKYEYIVAMEPQGRGAWHAHLLLIFKEKAPYIPNEEMSKIWGHGFTSTRKLDSIDNIGAYLTAYLGDMELNDCKNMSDQELLAMRSFGMKEIEIEDDFGVKQKKSFLKGARLCMYPPKFNLYRCSRGIKKPVINKMYEFEAQKKVSSLPVTYQKTLILKDHNINFDNKINYRYYNQKKSK